MFSCIAPTNEKEKKIKLPIKILDYKSRWGGVETVYFGAFGIKARSIVLSAKSDKKTTYLFKPTLNQSIEIENNQIEIGIHILQPCEVPSNIKVYLVSMEIIE
jgi:hypothetical protein